MHPLVRGAAAAAVLTALGNLDRPAPPPPAEAPVTAVKGVDGLPAPCGPGTLPEGPVCLRIPSASERGRTRLEPEGDETPEPGRSPAGLDRIPRRPDRPADPAAYVYPVGDAQRPPRLLGGLDSLPASTPTLTRDHGRDDRREQVGVRLAARPGEKVVLLGLAHQRGPAEVVFVGELFGPTVVTRHEVDEGGRKHGYLLFHGRLDHADAPVVLGARLEAGATLGFARTENGGGLVEIYLEARLLRDGAAGDEKKLTALAALDASVAVPIDLRDVLPRRP